MQISLLSFAVLVASINALKITSPTSGQVLDPTQPITVTWTSSAGDPATFDLLAVNPGSFISDTRVARDVSTSAGSYVIPAGGVQSYGIGFTIKADASDGTVLATSGSFDLSIGVVASTNGVATLVTAQTFTGAPATSQTAMASVTSTDSSSVLESASGTETSQSATPAPTNESSTSLSSSLTGFSTRTTSATSRNTATGASSTSASSATTSANAQPRLTSGSQIMLSGAGILAGLAALLA